MAGLLSEVRRLNHLGDRTVAEPFAGGAGASMKLLFLEETQHIFINDSDPAMHDLWWAIVHRSETFLQLVSSTRVSMAEWRRQRDVYRNSGRVSRLRRGFATFYLNRCNRSGIIMNGGPIGGIEQTGKWKLDARYNKKTLIARCRKIAEYRDRISVSGEDGIDFIKAHDPSSTFFFIDPPYFEKGQTLYLNALDKNYHGELALHLRAMKDEAWVLTYDDRPEVRRLYKGWATIRPFSLRYSASDRRTGKEIMVVPRWLQLPESQRSLAMAW